MIAKKNFVELWHDKKRRKFWKVTSEFIESSSHLLWYNWTKKVAMHMGVLDGRWSKKKMIAPLTHTKKNNKMLTKSFNNNNVHFDAGIDRMCFYSQTKDRPLLLCILSVHFGLNTAFCSGTIRKKLRVLNAHVVADWKRFLFLFVFIFFPVSLCKRYNSTPHNVMSVTCLSCDRYAHLCIGGCVVQKKNENP